MAEGNGLYDNASISVSYDGDSINFNWKETKGLKHYTFKLRHIHNKEHFVICTHCPKNSYKCKLDDDVKYGQIYEMRVQFVTNEIVSKTEWQEFVLGGPTVPIFPTVRLNQENPQRSVVIDWRKPELDPIGYQVTSIPLYGRRKTHTCGECNITISKLKSNTMYTFELQALFDKSVGMKERYQCKTTSIKTHPKPGTTLPTQTYDNIKDSTFHIKNPTSVQHSQVMKFNPSNFGKVENVEMITRSDGELEMAYIQWEEPFFLGERSDYEILQYEVRINQGSNTMFEWIVQNKLRTEEFMINKGECYEICIRAKYEEIDTEKSNFASFKEYFYSRPTIPNVRVIEEPNLVKVKWSGAKGAEGYRLEVFEANSTSVIVTEESGKSFTNHTISKDEFHLGRYYSFLVTVVGKGKRESHAREEILLGGELVPRNARAVLNPDNPANSIDIEWECPDKPPRFYKVTQVGCPQNCIETDEPHCTMTRLRSGASYKFQVIAQHEEEISCASVTNDVKTDPKPEKISEVNCLRCEQRPDKRIRVKWKPCVGAKIYRIRATCTDAVREHYVKGNRFTLDELFPSTSYEIAVSAGNDDGFGKENKMVICTEIEVPANVTLSYDATKDALVAKCSGGRQGLSAVWELRRRHDSFRVTSLSSDEPTCQFDTFEGNTEYYATAQFVCEERKSLTVSSNILLTVPSQVNFSSVTASDKDPSTDLHITWEQMEEFNYQLKIDTDHQTERILKLENCAECLYRCLREGNEYSVKIRAANKSGFGKWSSKAYVPLELPKVRGLTADDTGECLTIRWKKPQCFRFSPAISCYQVEIHENDDLIVQEKVKHKYFTFKNVKPTLKYNFSVAAVYHDDVFSKYESGSITVGTRVPGNVILRQDVEGDVLLGECDGGRQGVSAVWSLYDLLGNLTDSKTSEELSCQFDSFEGDTEYYLTVHFVYEEQKSEEVKSNALLTVPSQVSISCVTESGLEPSTDIHITWEPKDGLTYEIKIDTDGQTERIIRTENKRECI